ncbi:helix-turn-helix domain-containing protein [Microbacterium sp. SORGH_AS_0888]|uniref:helix-turn-helix transcriptional regulator n=1 Tax=Microbacterium sp. SORGH_AS_0888 TaxID=3041791 RepID=UPI0027867FF0|nr:helix-turn-helix domain-containing protein [Microbacterium sp. SORGH_AS_0888]MDQ1129961.1 DNA-binding NarL/FixJ family response regulator [Microbacterium sp. SORGH_AS_0888]
MRGQPDALLLQAVLGDPAQVDRVLREVAGQVRLGPYSEVVAATGLCRAILGEPGVAPLPGVGHWSDPGEAQIDAHLMSCLVVSLCRGELIEAEAYAESVRTRLADSGPARDAGAVAVVHAVLALTALVASADHATALVDAEHAVGIGGRAGRGIRRYVLAVLGAVRLYRGEIPDAAEALSRAEHVTGGEGWLGRHAAKLLLAVRAGVAVERNDPGARRVLARVREDEVGPLWPVLLLARARAAVREAGVPVVLEPPPAVGVVLPPSLGWQVLRSQRIALGAARGEDVSAELPDAEEAAQSPLVMAAMLCADPGALAAPSMGAAAARMRADTGLAPGERAEVLLAIAQAARPRLRDAELLREAARLVAEHDLRRIAGGVPALARWNRGGTRPGARMQGRPSPREVQVLAAVAVSGTVAEAAASLGISANTMKTQLKSLYRKLGVASRTEALVEAERRGLIR